MVWQYTARTIKMASGLGKVRPVKRNYGLETTAWKQQRFFSLWAAFRGPYPGVLFGDAEGREKGNSGRG